MKKVSSILLLLFMSLSARAQNSSDSLSTFLGARNLFLSSLEEKKLSDLAISVDDSVTMIFPDGEIMKGKTKFMQFNEAWFKKKWDIHTEIISTIIQNNIGYSLVRYEYQRYKADGSKGILSRIYLAVILKKLANKWYVVHNQHTKILI